MGDLAHQFFNTCLTVEYPCALNTYYIDPCSCQAWFICLQATVIIARNCSAGTLYNHESKNCDADESVVIIKKQCELDAPWKRCASENASADIISSLEARCTGVSPTTTPATTLLTTTLTSTASSVTTVAVQGGSTEQPQSNTGAIVGGVVAAVVLLALVVIVVILCKRKSAKKEEATLDENYAAIGDVVMNDPVYNGSVGPKLPDRPSFTFLSSQRDRTVTYDNPGYNPSVDNSDIIQGKTTPNDSVSFTAPSMYTKGAPPVTPEHPDPGQQTIDDGYEQPHIGTGHTDLGHDKRC